jgi:hypothetical protein
MQMTPDNILNAVLQLSEGDRLELAYRILDTVPPGPDLPSLDDPNFVEELERRAADDSGSIPWSQLKYE